MNTLSYNRAQKEQTQKSNLSLLFFHLNLYYFITSHLLFSNIKHGVFQQKDDSHPVKKVDEKLRKMVYYLYICQKGTRWQGLRTVGFALENTYKRK